MAQDNAVRTRVWLCMCDHLNTGVGWVLGQNQQFWVGPDLEMRVQVGAGLKTCTHALQTGDKKIMDLH